MNSQAFAHLLRWWCEELVRELLWGAWLHVVDREGDAQDRAFLRFCGLVNAAPCWPCRIDYSHPGRHTPDRHGAYSPSLCITSGQAAEEMDYFDDEY